ncbi:MAG: Ldh family oxidoreductase [Lentisphaerae bacterium]|nr:Ldh family oxidoreductase [Lentisphaerota bacterium]
MPLCELKDLVRFGEKLLLQHGLRPVDARFIAGKATVTEAAGISSHGVIMLKRILTQPGVSNPRAQPGIMLNRGAMALIDCEGCYSQVAMRQALLLGERKAVKYGLGMIAVRNGSWLGGLAAYVLPLAERGLLVQLWAQNSVFQDCVPFGGVDARLGTTPVCLAFAVAGHPVLADFSTSVMSMGRTMRMARDGRRAAEPCFFDRAGNLTDDPRAVLDGGALTPMGGPINGFKGLAFSLWAEALAAMSGGRTNNPRAPQRQCFNLLVIDPSMFGDMRHYQREMRRLYRWIRSSRPQLGGDGVRLPGARFMASLADARRHGVTLDDKLLKILNCLAVELDVPPLRLKKLKSAGVAKRSRHARSEKGR